MLERDSMLYWLARAAVGAREAAGRKQVHIAASANRDQSSIYRFEQAAKGKGGWPRDADRIVAAYADDLEIDPMNLWTMALELWREDREKVPERLTETAERVDGSVRKTRRGLQSSPARQAPAARKNAR